MFIFICFECRLKIPIWLIITSKLKNWWVFSVMVSVSRLSPVVDAVGVRNARPLSALDPPLFVLTVRTFSNVYGKVFYLMFTFSSFYLWKFMKQLCPLSLLYWVLINNKIWKIIFHSSFSPRYVWDYFLSWICLKMAYFYFLYFIFSGSSSSPLVYNRNIFELNSLLKTLLIYFMSRRNFSHYRFWKNDLKRLDHFVGTGLSLPWTFGSTCPGCLRNQDIKERSHVTKFSLIFPPIIVVCYSVHLSGWMCCRPICTEILFSNIK